MLGNVGPFQSISGYEKTGSGQINKTKSMEAVTKSTNFLTPRKAIIKNVDLSEDGQADALLFTAEALKTFQENKDIARHIKRGFEHKYGGVWHCVVGRDFGT
ncbi:Dynein light chain flagellar outer arm [Fasciola gigantica]|uniref:Dynein light chain n=1 Tax=Fasciola gigantica TaxID=46835 RepID=A0A504ZBS6_FASGI|nr:Dynein light chain flagellar outer arm [Fasciola gigantica]